MSDDLHAEIMSLGPLEHRVHATYYMAFSTRKMAQFKKAEVQPMIILLLNVSPVIYIYHSAFRIRSNVFRSSFGPPRRVRGFRSCLKFLDRCESTTFLAREASGNSFSQGIDYFPQRKSTQLICEH